MKGLTMPYQTPPPSMYRKSTELDNALQKYLLLSSQQESLRRRLSSSASTSTSGRSSPVHSATHIHSNAVSLSNSPTSYSTTSSDYMSWPAEVYPRPFATSGSGRYASSTAISCDSDDTVSDSELFDLNQAIKVSLTELLNRDEIRCEDHLRLWVQGRLMDTQLEMRRQRRRRSSASEGAAPAPLQRPVETPRSTVVAGDRPVSRSYGRNRSRTTSAAMPAMRRNHSSRGGRGYPRLDGYLMAGG